MFFYPSTRSHADELNEPFSITNQNPFVRIFGLPRHRSSEVLSAGEAESKIGYSVSSNYEFDISASRDLIAIDGEPKPGPFHTDEALVMGGKPEWLCLSSSTLVVISTEL